MSESNHKSKSYTSIGMSSKSSKKAFLISKRNNTTGGIIKFAEIGWIEVADESLNCARVDPHCQPIDFTLLSPSKYVI